MAGRSDRRHAGPQRLRSATPACTPFPIARRSEPADDSFQRGTLRALGRGPIDRAVPDLM